MHRNRLVASFGLVAGLAAASSAQAPSSNGNGRVDQKAVQSIRVKVIGCVAVGAEAGRYILTGAFLSGDDTPPTVGTAGKIGSGTDLSFENSLSYDLIGGRLKAHVGHEVEIIGITSDAKLNNRDAPSLATGSSKHEKATLTVTSVKMLAARCSSELSRWPACSEIMCTRSCGWSRPSLPTRSAWLGRKGLGSPELLKIFLAIGAAVILVVVVMRVAVRALRRFITHLWPH